MPFDSQVRIIENRPLGDAGFVLAFRSERLAAETLPGQFVMLGLLSGTDPLLRRPYSIYRVGRPGAPPDTCEIQYKVVGQGTARLAELRAGESLPCLGPLGQGFSIPAPDRPALLVAGGIGIAGLLHLAVALRDRDHPTRLLFGCRTAAELPLLEGFEAIGVPVEIATEDGSQGREGRVTALLDDHLGSGTGSTGGTEVFACGPGPMLRAVAERARGRAACQVSMESHMACGFGVCLGCVVETAAGEGFDRFVRVCMEGPVFPAEDLRW